MKKTGGDAINSRIYNRLRNYWWAMVRVCSSWFTYAKGSLQGVAIARGCRFFGVPLFIMSKGGSITIGSGCTLRSSKYSNPIGLPHACILSATPAYKGTRATLTIGEHCGLSGVSVWCFCQVYIGNNVRIGANTLIIDGDAHHDDPRVAPPRTIKIEDGVFIGANCVIKKGVTIGRGALVGMNSVVTHDIPPYSVAVGTPAKVVRMLNQ